MGFCLFNNVAVTAAALADRGERVLIVDYDAHHGNGTQDIFYDDPRVLYVSFHEWPLYPGTGALRRDRATATGPGTTVNFPLPAGATGDVYRARHRRRSSPPLVEAFAPDVAAASRPASTPTARDPLTGLGLTSGDYADLTARLLGARARRAAASCSSRAATTSRRWPTSAGAALGGAGRRSTYRPERADGGRPRARASSTPSPLRRELAEATGGWRRVARRSARAPTAVGP